MRILFFVNDIQTEHPSYTTTLLAGEAAAMGHDVWYVGAGDFVYDRDDRLRAHARRVPQREFRSGEQLLERLRGKSAAIERITVDDLDVLMLRANPADELTTRPWAATAGIVFGQLAARHGVLVLNDPQGLAGALNKLYLQDVPRDLRPDTMITRDPEEIREFVKQLGGKAVLKPLQGSGGRNVFLIDEHAIANLNQIIAVEMSEGYVIVQEYLPDAGKGDIRLFLMNGEPLEQRGKYAAMLRTSIEGDLRSNMHAGGKASKATITEAQLAIAEAVRPKLVRDGMFLVGLDIAGDKLMEINVFSPGGLSSIGKITGVNFARLVLDDVQRKVSYRQAYGQSLSNVQLAVM